MKRIFSIITLALVLFTASAQEAEFQAANELYTAGEYHEAALRYEELVQQYASADVYYNLGNAYFKQGELAQSILAYERALRLDPRHKDAQYNLAFAQSRIVDNIEDHAPFFLSQWMNSLRISLRESTWMWLSIGLFILCLIGFIVFAFVHPMVLRKIGFHTAWVALLCSLVSLIFAIQLHHRDVERKEAIVVQSIVNAKSSPDKSGTDLFVLHEGTKVSIRSTLSDWAEIHVGNNRGWVRLTAVERI